MELILEGCGISRNLKIKDFFSGPFSTLRSRATAEDGRPFPPAPLELFISNGVVERRQRNEEGFGKDGQ